MREPKLIEQMAVAYATEIERLRAVIYEITTNGKWTDGEQCGDWKISKEVYETARDAIADCR